MKTFISGLLNKEPAHVIGAGYSVAAGAAAFFLSLQESLDGISNWGQAVFVIAATVLPLLQGKLTRESVYSPQTVETIAISAQIEGHNMAIEDAAVARKDAAKKAAATKAKRQAEAVKVSTPSTKPRVTKRSKAKSAVVPPTKQTRTKSS